MQVILLSFVYPFLCAACINGSVRFNVCFNPFESSVVASHLLICVEKRMETQARNQRNRQIAEERIAVQKRESKCNFPSFGGSKFKEKKGEKNV